MDLPNQPFLSVCPDILHDESFDDGHDMQTFQPNSFVPAMLAWSPVILCHFQWPSLLLRVTRQAEGKTCWVHFLAHFSADQDEVDMVLKLLKLNILILL